jgi:hypothetical protein
MLDFASAPEQWRQAGLKGQQRLIENYDFIAVVRSYLPIIHNVLGTSDRRVKSAEVNA